MKLFDLPIEDIVYKSIFPYLTLADIISLRKVNKSTEQIVLNYVQKYCTIMRFEKIFSRDPSACNAFWELLESNMNVKAIIFDDSLDEKCLGKDDVLMNAMENNPHIEKLTFRMVESSSKVYEYISKNLHYLQYIDFSSCSLLKSEHLSKIGQNCHDLKSIILDGCYYINDEGVLSIIENNPKLELISLKYCIDLTDDVFSFITKTCSTLHTVDFSGSKVGDRELKAIVETLS